MNEIFVTLDANYIKFEDVKITVIIDNDNNTWFNANETAKFKNHRFLNFALTL